MSTHPATHPVLRRSARISRHDGRLAITHLDEEISLEIDLDPMPDWDACEYVGKLYTALGRSSVYKDMRHRRTRCVYIDYADEFAVPARMKERVEIRAVPPGEKAQQVQFDGHGGSSAGGNSRRTMATAPWKV